MRPLDADMKGPVDLGCFSVSLAVRDLDRSVKFYEALGVSVIGGDGDYRILSNGTTKIGAFTGIFEGNILTFNPGLPQNWPDYADEGVIAGPGDEEGLPGPLEGFTDVRVIERRLRDAGVELTRGTATESGPDHLMLTDPDGNQILIDQFF